MKRVDCFHKNTAILGNLQHLKSIKKCQTKLERNGGLCWYLQDVHVLLNVSNTLSAFL